MLSLPLQWMTNSTCQLLKPYPARMDVTLGLLSLLNTDWQSNRVKELQPSSSVISLSAADSDAQMFHQFLHLDAMAYQRLKRTQENPVHEITPTAYIPVRKIQLDQDLNPALSANLYHSPANLSQQDWLWFSCQKPSLFSVPMKFCNTLYQKLFGLELLDLFINVSGSSFLMDRSPSHLFNREICHQCGGTIACLHYGFSFSASLCYEMLTLMSRQIMSKICIFCPVLIVGGLSPIWHSKVLPMPWHMAKCQHFANIGFHMLLKRNTASVK